VRLPGWFCRAPAEWRHARYPPTIGTFADRDPRSARAGTVLEHISPLIDLAAKTAIRRPTTQIYEGTNQIQRMVMARQLLKG
jgi:alkylation response protein AidB-like acyl-CoA dehydrogenase